MTYRLKQPFLSKMPVAKAECTKPSFQLLAIKQNQMHVFYLSVSHLHAGETSIKSECFKSWAGGHWAKLWAISDESRRREGKYRNRPIRLRFFVYCICIIMWHSHLNDMEIPGTKRFIPKGFELGTTLS